MKELYHISIRVRGEDFNVIKDKNGIKRHSLSLELNVNKKELRFSIVNIGQTMGAWMPEASITVEASVFNSISDTYMLMNSYYVDEERYITH